jgi:hypothetical protein
MGLVGSCHEQELLALSARLDRVLDVTQATSLLDPGAGAWPRVATVSGSLVLRSPTGACQCPTRSGVQPRADGLRALVEQSIRS